MAHVAKEPILRTDRVHPCLDHLSIEAISAIGQNAAFIAPVITLAQRCCNTAPGIIGYYQ